MDRKPFHMLARIIQTLAVGRPVELPFALGARDTEWSETFVVGTDHVNGGDAVLHGSSSRKNGKTTVHRPEITEWSLGDMLGMIVEWDEDTFAHVDRSIMPLENPGPTVEGIADLQDGTGVVIVSGRVWSREDDKIAMMTDGDGKWSLDEAVTAVRAGR